MEGEPGEDVRFAEAADPNVCRPEPWAFSFNGVTFSDIGGPCHNAIYSIAALPPPPR